MGGVREEASGGWQNGRFLLFILIFSDLMYCEESYQELSFGRATFRMPIRDPT